MPTVTGITLVNQTPNRLRYLVVSVGTGDAPVASFITCTGAATPDLITDTVAGPLKNLANAAVRGFGSFAAGALTQAQARALWLSDNSGADPGLRQTARVTFTPVLSTTVAGSLLVDADVSGGNPRIALASAGNVANETRNWYLDIEVPGAIGE